VLFQEGFNSQNTQFLKFLDLQNIDRLVVYFVVKLRTNYAIKIIDSGCLRVMKNIFRCVQRVAHNLKSFLKTNILGRINRGEKNDVVCSRHSRNQKCVKHFDLKT
jgi:hypothetical protein